MQGPPRWLTICTVGVVAAIGALSLGWWGACTFYIGPRMWQLYVKTDGRLPSAEPEVCRDVDSRSLQTLTALLATLIGLASRPPDSP